MRNRFILLCLPMFAAVLSAQGWRGGPFLFPGSGWMGPSSLTPVTGAPYSGIWTVQVQQALPGGNQIARNEQSKAYRDSQGRTRIERTITPPASSGRQPFTEVTIVDPVAGYRYMLNSSNMTAIRTPLPHPRSAMTGGSSTPSPGRRNRGQITTVSLGTQTVNGVLATGTQVTDTIPAGAVGNEQAIQIVRIIWTSTDLKVPVEIKSSDPRFGTTDMELTSIVRSEPDPSLFLIPSGYTIRERGR